MKHWRCCCMVTFVLSYNSPIMACLRKLKEDIVVLETLFPKNHERLQVHRLVSELCRHFNLTIPSELVRLAPPEEDEKDEGQGSDMETDEDDLNEVVDPDSPLAGDLTTLAHEHKQDHILFHFVFNENFPCEPPFVRLVSPTMSISAYDHDHGYLASATSPVSSSGPVPHPVASVQRGVLGVTSGILRSTNTQSRSVPGFIQRNGVYPQNPVSVRPSDPMNQSLHGPFGRHQQQYAYQSEEGHVIYSNTTAMGMGYVHPTSHYGASMTSLNLAVPVREPSPEPIRNVVCNYTLPLHIDLRKLALNSNNVTFDRGRGVLLKQKRNPNCYVKIYSSGKVYIVGCKSESDCMIAARTIARQVQKTMQKMNDIVKIRNYKLAQKYPAQSQYEPELSVGLVWRSVEPKATLRVHTTGSITVTGASSEVDVMRAIEIIYPIVREFRCPMRLRGDARKKRAQRKRVAPVARSTPAKRPALSGSGVIGNKVYFSDEDEIYDEDDLLDDED
uniref:TBP-like factor n=1 Tax=Heterorhabditis bacteriophora TaxID=37862 RepID=A0A1I7XPQ6_HETBA